MALPACLAHLVIYNSTLVPSVPTDDEDALEHAHICFYTSRERAVSRNRMLRQVGLAKALVNFSGMYSGDTSFSNVHSQKKRLVTISPEHNWWIHAAFDLAKAPRPTPTSSKARDKAKEKPPERIEYDYSDSLDGEVLREYIMRGYEQFKLLHGSLSELFQLKGRSSFERELERFFTVWAWRWYLSSTPEFLSHLACTPLHPRHSEIIGLLPQFTPCISHDTEILLVCHSYLLYSSAPSLPPSLLSHLMSLLPPPLPPASPRSTASTLTPSSAEEPSILSQLTRPKNWWPGYLSFGRSSSKSGHSKEAHRSLPITPPAVRETSDGVPPEDSGKVDTDALVDALEGGPQITKAAEAGSTSTSDKVAVSMPRELLQPPLEPSSSPARADDHVSASPSEKSVTLPATPSEASQPVYLTSFTTLRVHLPTPDSSSLRQANILHLTSEGLVLAFIPPSRHEDVQVLGDEDSRRQLEEATHAFLGSIRRILDDKAPPPESSSTPEMRFVIHNTVNSTAVFSPSPPNSPLLFSAQSQLQHSRITQSLSRAALHWVVAEQHDSGGQSEDVYVEIMRKDINLSEAEKAVSTLVADRIEK